MNKLKEFIEVTAMRDGKKACIRAASIECVMDNAEVDEGERVIKACRTIMYSGNCIDVMEEYDDILDQMWRAEM